MCSGRWAGGHRSPGLEGTRRSVHAFLSRAKLELPSELADFSLFSSEPS